MRFNIIALPTFQKQIKKLAKKHTSLKEDFAELVEKLESNPEQGKSLGRNCYKIRLAIKSKRKGKSGGARIITNIVIAETTVYLLTIYDKSDQADLSDKELEELLKDIPE